MDDLKSYIKSSLDKNVDPKKIKADLVQLGWQEKDVEQVLGEFVSQVPAPGPAAPLPPTMLEIFSGFFSLSLLWSVALALGTLWFQIINKILFDPLADKGGYSLLYYFSPASDTLLRGAIATLVITFPLYLFSIWFIFRNFRNKPQQKESRLIKWFTYITLFAAGSSAMNELISLIRNFLEGELGWRVFLRALTILVIASLGIVFYLFERKKIEFRKTVNPVVFVALGGIATLLVLSGVVWGLVLAGQPGVERMKKFDAERATYLSSLESGIVQFVSSNNRLPSDLDELKKNSASSYYAKNANDPETKKSFEYRVISSGPLATYELCANFSLSNLGENESTGVYDYTSGYNNSKWSKHDKGRICNQGEVPLRQQLPINQYPLYPVSPTIIKNSPIGE